MKQSDDSSPEIIIPSKREYSGDAKVQQEIERLERHCIVRLESMQQFISGWTENVALAEPALVIGDSRTGKMIAVSFPD